MHGDLQNLSSCIILTDEHMSYVTAHRYAVARHVATCAREA